jgi:hypothetical protein
MGEVGEDDEDDEYDEDESVVVGVLMSIVNVACTHEARGCIVSRFDG